MAFNENILKRAKEREEKKGIYYHKKGDMLYNICKWIYVLAFAFTMVINSLYLGGIFIVKNELPSNTTINMNGFITVCILTAVMLAMLVLSRFNANYIVAGVFGAGNVISCVFLTIVFAQMLGNTYVNLPAKFYLLHLLPLAIIAVCSLVMAGIVINSYFKIKKSYDLVLEVVFSEYNALPDDQKPEWDEYVDNFKF